MTPPSLRATLLTLADCHLCEHAHHVLQRLGLERPIVIEELGWDTPAGQALVRREGIPFAPALFIDGVFCGYGRISEGAVRSWLKKNRKP